MNRPTFSHRLELEEWDGYCKSLSEMSILGQALSPFFSSVQVVSGFKVLAVKHSLLATLPVILV